MAPAASRVGDLSLAEFSRRMTAEGLGVRIGPFDVALHVRVPQLDATLHRLYRDYPVLSADQDFSFHVRLDERMQWWPRPQRMVRFMVDGRCPHEDLPAEQALAVLEWGINLVIALRYHCFLMLHAAVVERAGCALLLPAEPGSGKSTLCAALVQRGWRLLSDEFGLVRPGTIELVPLPRLTPLKNESMAVMAAYAPGAEWGPVIPNTRKGTLKHLQPSREAIDRASENARARWIVFPKWQADAGLRLEPLPRVEGFAQLASNAFNYEMLGLEGFRTVAALIEASDCYTLDYSRLDEAVAALDALVQADAR